CEGVAMKARSPFIALPLLMAVLAVATFSHGGGGRGRGQEKNQFDRIIDRNAAAMVQQGRQIFRFDTFGDEAFWGDTLMLHRAIEGAKFGGVGPGVSPGTALALGLKVDADALPQKLLRQLKQGQIDLNDPASTLALLKED